MAALAGCVDCTTATLRAVVLLDSEPDEDGSPTPMAVAWEHVVEHLRLGHGLASR